MGIDITHWNFMVQGWSYEKKESNSAGFFDLHIFKITPNYTNLSFLVKLVNVAGSYWHVIFLGNAGKSVDKEQTSDLWKMFL